MAAHEPRMPAGRLRGPDETYMTGDSCPRCTLVYAEPREHRLDRRYARRRGDVPWLRYRGPHVGPPVERWCPVCGFRQRWSGAAWETVAESRWVIVGPPGVARTVIPEGRTVRTAMRRAAPEPLARGSEALRRAA